MCGRYSQYATAEQLREIFRFLRSVLPETSGPVPDVPDFFTPRYNIAPTQQVLTILASDGQRIARTMRWGLIPHWAKDTKGGPPLINARSETVQTKPAFRQAFLKRRCLIPATGFYEWRTEGKIKQPFHIHMNDDRPFGFAGLWESWTREGETVDSCTIITTEANEFMRTLHDRMPVIVAPADYGQWLEAPAEEVVGLMRPYQGNDLIAGAVSTLVNSPRNEVPACIEPVSA